MSMTGNISHKVHGTDGNDAPADWPPLQADEVSAVLARYPQAGALQTIDWRSPRPLSAAAVVTTSQGRLFVKRHHQSVRSCATLAEEHGFMAHLRAASMPVPQVLTTDEGASALAQGSWTFEVHRAIDGEDLYRDLVSWQPLENLTHARAAGRALAQLHRASSGYDAPQRHSHVLVTRDELLCAPDLIAELEDQLPQRPALAEALARQPWREALRDTIVPRQQRVQARAASEPRLWCHNDWHASNLAWRGRDAEVSMAFDFGLASPTFALFDLATAIERNAIAWLELPRTTDIARIATAQALIAGYAEITPLADNALELLADLLPVVHVDFALSELEYFHGITRSRHDADAAWSDFLLGHARWFDNPAAHALQQAIAGG